MRKRHVAILLTIMLVLLLTGCAASLSGTYSGLSAEGLPISMTFNSDGTMKTNLFGFDVSGKYTLSGHRLEITVSMLGMDQSTTGVYENDVIKFADVTLKKGSIGDLMNPHESEGAVPEEETSMLSSFVSNLEDDGFKMQEFIDYMQKEPETAKDELYIIATDFLNRGYYSKAMLCFQALESFSDAKEKVQFCKDNEELLENYEYKHSNDGLILTKYTAYERVVVIPHGTYELYNASGMYYSVFGDNTRIEDVVFPSTIKKIGDHSFEGCTSLQQINIPSSIESIGSYAFTSSGLQEVIVPSSISNLGSYAFSNCTALKKATLDYSDMDILPYGIFRGCTNLEEVTVPSHIEDFSEYVFAGCSNLRQIDLPSNLKKIRMSSFSDCESLESVSLPDSITEVGAFAFSNCKALKAISIPEGVTQIGVETFAFCTSLSSVSLPKSVEIISGSAFFECAALKEIVIPKKVKKIEWNAFLEGVDGTYDYKCLDIMLYIYEDSGAHRIIDEWNSDAYHGQFKYSFITQ